MATTDNGNREREIFEAALEITSAEERLVYLKRACGEDAALLARVQALLQSHEAPEGFLPEQPKAAATVKLELDTEKPGDRIGHYKLLEQIGEGGCGVVYMAEQQEPIRRRVALKVIKLGMETRHVIARFEAERQALALMDHPNIAKVLDAGATATGRPYFVMELVRGTKITDYCDENHLSTEERLNLFVQVCQAIQHAHQKGIIHRDIKPSNILVTINDPDQIGIPKIIDFGIAKAIGQQLTDKTFFTAFEQFIGTPAYMSPEQAVLTSLDIDTRSDIYALGVLLYELLTGHTPFEPKQLVAAGIDEMRRIIREQEPPRPSTRLTRELVAADVRRLRSATGRPLTEEEVRASSRRLLRIKETIHLVRGDLDWIVMKCLEKDRSRRYETANGLADDVLRHLSDEPVSARPPSRLYRLEKLARRNKLTFAAAAAVAAALVIGLGLSTWLFLRERAAYARAVAAEDVQSQLRQQAQAEAQFFKGMLEGVGPSFAQGRDTTMVKEILDKAAERVSKDLKNEPEVGAELQSTIGDTYAAFGQYAKAEEMHRTALAQRRALWGNLNTNVADSLDKLGRVLFEQYLILEAEPFILEALAIRTNLLGLENVQVPGLLENLAEVRWLQTRPAEAEPLLRQSLAINRKVSGNDSPALARSLGHLCGFLALHDRADEAEPLAREAFAILARLPESEKIGTGMTEAQVHLNLVAFAQGKLDQAETAFREQLALHRKLLGPEHPAVGRDLQMLAWMFMEQGKSSEAEAAAREGLAILRKTLGQDHFVTASCLHTLGGALEQAGRPLEAEAAYRAGLATSRNVPTSDVGVRYLLAGSLARLLPSQGKTAEAEALYHEAIAAARRDGSARSLEGMLAGFGDLLRGQGKLAEAEPLYREGLELARKAQFTSPAHRQWLAAGLGSSLQSQGKLAQAEPLYREALTNAVKLWPKDPAKWQWILNGLADVLQSQGKAAEAEQVKREFLTRPEGTNAPAQLDRK